MKVKGKNIFVNYLSLLGVRYTESFSDQYFNGHPNKNNLYGLSKMLSDYGIQNAATQIEDKETDIACIECPFVAQFGVVCSGGDSYTIDCLGISHCIDKCWEKCGGGGWMTNCY